MSGTLRSQSRGVFRGGRAGLVSKPHTFSTFEISNPPPPQKIPGYAPESETDLNTLNSIESVNK